MLSLLLCLPFLGLLFVSDIGIIVPANALGFGSASGVDFVYSC